MVEIESALLKLVNSQSDIIELRKQTNFSHVIEIKNGKIITDIKQDIKGIAARTIKNGCIGFSSSPYNADIDMLIMDSLKNAENLNRNLGGEQVESQIRKFLLPHERHYYLSSFFSKQLEKLREYALKIDKYMELNCKGLFMRSINVCELGYDKELAVTNNSYLYISQNNVYINFTMSAQAKEGNYVQLFDSLSFKENFTDTDFEKIREFIDIMYQRVLEKKRCIVIESGVKTIVLSSKLTSIVTHEVVGHIAEADNVRAGSIANSYLDKKIASELINITDFANNYKKEILPVEVYIDDEGTRARDVEIIQNGYFKGLMTDLKTATYYGIEATGNARGMYYFDSPLVRMRNTALLPGNDSEEGIIDSIKDGYYLILGNEGKSSLSGEFSLTSDFGYEIKNGRLGRPLGNVRVIGNCFDMLNSIDMISSRVEWYFGMCKKEQMIPVSNGGPVIRCKANLGSV